MRAYSTVYNCCIFPLCSHGNIQQQSKVVNQSTLFLYWSDVEGFAIYVLIDV